MAAPAQPVTTTHRPRSPYRVLLWYAPFVVGLFIASIADSTNAWIAEIIVAWIILLVISYRHAISAAEKYAIDKAVQHDFYCEELDRRR